MINTGINTTLLNEIFRLYGDAENKMLKKVAKGVKSSVTEPNWNKTKLDSLTNTRRQLENILKTTTGQAKQKVSDGLVSSYMKGVNSANKDLGFPPTVLKDVIPFQLQRLILESNHLLDNTAFKALRTADDAYRSVIAQNSSGVLMGTETRLQASQKALNQLASKGITGFTDKLGRKWDMGSYVEMATRTTTSHAALQGHIDRQLDLGHDLVLVSSFASTCPLCAPWAGQVLSITGNTPGYPTVEQAKEAGLFHPNCKHTLSAYFSGG
jgi:hypothetical protein